MVKKQDPDLHNKFTPQHVINLVKATPSTATKHAKNLKTDNKIKFSDTCV